ncbi:MULTISPECIES: heavy-metal-associated domain-containing protein [Corynebacterium]|uniref:Heavy-metal-associated domain-containing protein n=1 Tax=Corynebacterium intestinale TaxID=2943492 RepID=A0ABT0TAP2_9CORY|nr:MULTISPECIES: heavy-metal-associated domain-containing protein [Corynebacterium]MCG7261219.1 heavy-metal-associated domain-containing protein [Corynebacterium aurimucosum]MCL8494143.1 heavy-metal-associated domain-containing protein [Corynebacterium intestinale]MCP1390379.1 heavy-metal-associated domain-containing protein [Corynebacterium intestinale]MDK8897134.1 heavy-metal-associated domain-containing protein [Corynebacterium sp. MSK004]OFN18870.1 transporter [Corynebacterium sp. HMSC055A
MSTTTYTVNGMTCGHCELSVKEEISEIKGVTDVTADHTTGAVTVTGEGFSDDQVAAAIAEAGYELA